MIGRVTVIAGCVAILAVATPSDAAFFQTASGQQSLVASDVHICIRIDTSVQGFSDSAFAQSHLAVDDTALISHFERGYRLFRLTDGYDYEDAVAELESDTLVRRLSPVYVTPEGDEVVVTDVICLNFEDSITTEGAIEMLNQHGLHYLDSVGYRRNRWDVALDDTTSMATVDLANQIHDVPGVQWACPSIYIDVMMQSAILDPYFQYQYYFRDLSSDGGYEDVDIDADSAWLFSAKQQEFVIAVLDNGLSPHPDLDWPRLRMDLGRDFVGPDPEFPREDSVALPGDCSNHGMACAGILAAGHNEIGIMGVFDACTIVPIKVFSDDGESVPGRRDKATGYEKAIKYADSIGARVMSCSWSFPYFEEYLPIASAIAFASYGCEDELDPDTGSVMVFAAGNSGGSVLFPAYMDQVIAVGAVNKSNTRWGYSCTGAALDLVAPSGDALAVPPGLLKEATADCPDIGMVQSVSDQKSLATAEGMWTIDQAGTKGWHTVEGSGDAGDVDYTSLMGGTSGACPQVAGVAGLILARRPDLPTCYPIDTVLNILTGSAEHIGTPIPNQYTGYGRLSAYRAMLAVARGDANGDAHYNLADIVETIHQLNSSWTPGIHKGLSDLNCDGVVDNTDVTLMLNIAFSDAPWPDPCFEFDY